MMFEMLKRRLNIFGVSSVHTITIRLLNNQDNISDLTIGLTHQQQPHQTQYWRNRTQLLMSSLSL